MGADAAKQTPPQNSQKPSGVHGRATGASQYLHAERDRDNEDSAYFEV
jgi:hypothetical protein